MSIHALQIFISILQYKVSIFIKVTKLLFVFILPKKVTSIQLSFTSFLSEAYCLTSELLYYYII